MISKLLNAIFNLIVSLISLVLTPLELLIENALPSLSDALTMIGSFFDYVSGFTPVVISYTGLTTATISIIVMLILANLNIPLVVHTVKLAIKWFDKIKIG